MEHFKSCVCHPQKEKMEGIRSALPKFERLRRLHLDSETKLAQTAMARKGGSAMSHREMRAHQDSVLKIGNASFGSSLTASMVSDLEAPSESLVNEASVNLQNFSAWHLLQNNPMA